MSLERDLDLDALVYLHADLDQLRGLLELARMRDLRFIGLLFLNESQLSKAVWHNLVEDLAEVVIQAHEVSLKSLLLLVVHVMQELQDPLLGLDLLLKLFEELPMFGRVLIVPLDAMSILPRHLVQLQSLLLDLLGQPLDSFTLDGLRIHDFVEGFNLPDEEVKFIIPRLELIHFHAQF